MTMPHIDPVAISIGSLQLRWYGLMYLIGFAVGWGLGRWRASRPGSGWRPADVDDLLTCVMLGIILGGRLGYVLFYDLPVYIHDPVEILRIWNGGMSFHGGLLGVLGAFWYFARSRKKSFLEVSDFVAPLVPQGLFFGRLGNFINGELWGKVSDAPLGDGLSRAAARMRVILPSSMKPCWKACCCSSWSGSTPASRASPARCPGCLPWVTACPVLWWNSCACPTPAGLPGLRLADHGAGALPAVDSGGLVAALP